MKLKISYILSCVFLVMALPDINAQIVDDSTKETYGNNTVWITRIENEAIPDNVFKETLDTSFDDFHQYNLIGNENEFYQSLGTYNSAHRKYDFNHETVFRQLSFDPYKAYHFDHKAFYKTLSPVSKLGYFAGTPGDIGINGLYSVNFQPNKNIGMEFSRSRTKKQYPSISAESSDASTNFLSSSTLLRFFGSHHSYNKKYNLYVNYNSHNYLAREQGGFDYFNLDPYYDAYVNYRYNGLDGDLLDAYSRYEYRSLDIYNHYNFDTTGKFTVFHTFNRSRTNHKFIDDEIDHSYELDFYDTIILDSHYSFNQWKLDEWKNQFGLGLNLKKLKGEVSLHQRNYRYFSFTETEKHPLKTEIAIQGILKYRHKLSEFKLNSMQSFTGAFSHKISLEHKLFEVAYHSKLQLPYMIYEDYRSNFVDWKNNLRPMTFNQFNVATKYKDYINVGINLENISNYIRLDSNLSPQQLTSGINMVRPYLNLQYEGAKFGLRSFVRYNVGNNEALGIPDLTSRTTIFIKYKMFNKIAQGRLGCVVKTLSVYRPFAYSPEVHDFYYQDQFITKVYPNLDIYTDIKIKRMKIFIKGSNLLEPIMGWNFETANYPMNLLYVTFGLNWTYFD